MASLTNSNLYAERVYAEHPLGLWPLDDDVAYIQMISGSAQLLSNWNHTGLAESVAVHSGTAPLAGQTTRLSLSMSAVLSPSISAPFVLAASSFSTRITTACFSMHVYHESVFLEKIQIGIVRSGIFEYTEYEFDNNDGWSSIAHTFDVPTSSITLVVRPFFSSTGSLSDRSLETALVSVGQWSEPFLNRSPGVIVAVPPVEIQNLLTAGSNYYCITADAYGLDTSINGYYLVNDHAIMARSSGIPLAFGSSQVTSVLAAPDSNPSILIPAFGMLNEAGMYNNYTLEAWLRLDNTSDDEIKLIGSVDSANGVYVEEGFISLRIGPYAKSYFVGRWYRPMLVHFKYSSTLCSLLVNGEEVISLPIDIDNVTFGTADWIGVYGNSKLKPFEIDCIGIYPYQLPLEMAKRRFVYGQGVQDSDLSSSEYISNTTLFDYAYSDYSANMIYPDMTMWRSGSTRNLDANSSYLTTPKYGLPEIQIKQNSRLLSEFDWYYANKQVNQTSPEPNPYIQIRPYYEYGTWDIWSNIWNSGANIWNGYVSTTWEDVSVTAVVNDDILYSDVTLYYDDLAFTNEKTVAVSGVFKSPLTPLDEQIIFAFTNKSSGDQLKVVLRFNQVQYAFERRDGTKTLLHADTIEDDAVFVAGLDIEFVARNYRSVIGSFFSVLENVSLNIGGYFNDSFAGKIFSVNFHDRFFVNKDLDTMFVTGFISTGGLAVTTLTNYIANYTLLPVEQDTIMALDIGARGYWEDYQPLSSFGKYVVDKQGDQYYDLDMLQINMDAGKRGQLETVIAASLLYGDLTDLFASYDDLSNVMLTGWDTYASMVGASAMSSGSANASIAAFLTFQRYYEVGKKPYSDFTNLVAMDYTNVVQFNDAAYKNTKYEIGDNTIVLPPKYPNFDNYYIGLHLEFVVRGILQRNMKLRRLEIASLAFNESSPYRIGTKNSIGVYPFTRAEYLFNFKQPNPVTIYKDSSPYLYLTEYSGIFVNPFESNLTRGVLVPINSDKQPGYSVAGIQFWSRYPYENFPTVPFIAANFTSESVDIDFYLEPDADGSRATLRAYDNLTHASYTDLTFYQNGYEVKNPIFCPREWNAVNISFGIPLTMANYTGRIELYAGLVFNNINEYSFDHASANAVSSTYAKWYGVYVDPATELVQSWDAATDTQAIDWRTATLMLTTAATSLDGQLIYDNQTGIAASVTEDLSIIKVFSNGADVFTDVIWETFEAVPV